MPPGGGLGTGLLNQILEWNVASFAFQKALDVIRGFTESLRNAAEMARSFGRSLLITGASGAEGGRLSALGGAVGLSPGDMAEMARGLQQAVQSGYGMAYAMQAGVYNPPGPFGRVDQGKNLLRAIDYLRMIDEKMGRQEAIRRGRELRLEGIEPLLNVSQQQLNLSKKDSAILAKVYNPSAIRTEASYDAARNRFGQMSSALSFEMINGLHKVLIPFLNLAASIMGGISGNLNQGEKPKRPTREQMENALKVTERTKTAMEHGSVLERAAAKLGEMMGGASPKDLQANIDKMKWALGHWDEYMNKWGEAHKDATTATEDNTAALNALGIQIQDASRLIFGGAERAQGALPANIRGTYLSDRGNMSRYNRALESEAMIYGPFAL